MAVSFKILSLEQSDDTLFATVAYTQDSVVVVPSVRIAVFQPADQAEVVQAIKNRWQSEKRKLKAASDVSAAIRAIALDQDTDIAGG